MSEDEDFDLRLLWLEARKKFLLSIQEDVAGFGHQYFGSEVFAKFLGHKYIKSGYYQHLAKVDKKLLHTLKLIAGPHGATIIAAIKARKETV